MDKLMWKVFYGLGDADFVVIYANTDEEIAEEFHRYHPDKEIMCVRRYRPEKTLRSLTTNHSDAILLQGIIGALEKLQLDSTVAEYLTRYAGY